MQLHFSKVSVLLSWRTLKFTWLHGAGLFTSASLRWPMVYRTVHPGFMGEGRTETWSFEAETIVQYRREAGRRRRAFIARFFGFGVQIDAEYSMRDVLLETGK